MNLQYNKSFNETLSTEIWTNVFLMTFTLKKGICVIDCDGLCYFKIWYLLYFTINKW